MKFYKVIDKDGVSWYITGDDKQTISYQFVDTQSGKEKSTGYRILRVKEPVGLYISEVAQIIFDIEPIREDEFYEAVLDALEVQDRILDDEYFTLKQKRGGD